MVQQGTRIEVLRQQFHTIIKRNAIVMEMKMKERKIERNVWSRSECKVGTKKTKRP